MGGRDAADREQQLLATHVEGEQEGTDSLTFLAGPGVYIIHVGGGVAASRAALGERRMVVPPALLDRLCWLLALALDHADSRAA